VDATTHPYTPGTAPGGAHIRDEIEQLLRFFRQMLKIRLFEEQVNDLYRSARMPGLAHLYIGQEAVAVGVCEALLTDDYITSTHRGHGHCLAKGGAPDRMFAELLGKQEGYCRGKGGSMHIADQQSGNLGANAIVGGSAGIAAGAALSAKMRGTSQVAVCFFGEGALGQGLLYEVMNMASLWSLPLIFVCENNMYNEYTHYRETTAGEILDRPRAFGIHAEEVNGQDVLEVHAATQRLVQRSREGLGPAFLQCNTYRFHGHYVGDVDRAYYRSKQEEHDWVTRRDPISLFGARMMEQGVAEQRLSDIREEARREILAGVEYALNCPFPAESEVDENVYS
jgi:pyruvate dehydrogenase E1 component alpha subunit